MKKRLFGYHTQEVDSTIATLNDEKHKLNSNLESLDNKIKSMEERLGKTSTLETDLEKSNLELNELHSINQELNVKLKSLSAELYKLQEENILLTAQLEENQNSESKEAKSSAAVYSPLEPLSQDEIIKNLKEQVQQLSSEKVYLITELEELKQLNTEYSLELDEVKLLDKGLVSKQSLASEISLRAFCDMSRINNEVADRVHDIMKDYYKFTSDNNIAIRSEIEQYQREYNEMINNFVITASKLPIALSNIENKYSTLANYSMNTELLFKNMNQTINKFMSETTETLKTH